MSSKDDRVDDDHLAVLVALCSLLNVQDSTKFRLAKSVSIDGSSYTPSFGISTVGQPKTVHLISSESLPEHEASAGDMTEHKSTGLRCKAENDCS